MSNQDEDEVEDELEALELEQLSTREQFSAPNEPVISVPLPDAPTTNIDEDTEKLQRQKERAKARRVALEA